MISHFFSSLVFLLISNGTQSRVQMPKKNHHAKAVMVTDRFSSFTPAS